MYNLSNKIYKIPKREDYFRLKISPHNKIVLGKHIFPPSLLQETAPLTGLTPQEDYQNGELQVKLMKQKKHFFEFLTSVIPLILQSSCSSCLGETLATRSSSTLPSSSSPPSSSPSSPSSPPSCTSTSLRLAQGQIWADSVSASHSSSLPSSSARSLSPSSSASSVGGQLSSSFSSSSSPCSPPSALVTPSSAPPPMAFGPCWLQ